VCAAQPAKDFLLLVSILQLHFDNTACLYWSPKTSGKGLPA
jgi:hypothetical protein